MPKFSTETMDNPTGVGAATFKFSGATLDQLTEAEYTLATIAVDKTGSVSGFANELLEALRSCVKACQKSPRKNNLLLRVIFFDKDVHEIHGFVPLNSIDPDKDYQSINCYGSTALFNATFDAVGATVVFGNKLAKQSDINVNGAVYVITDGDDNMGGCTPKMILKKIEEANQGEQLESLTTVLVGVNTTTCSGFLQRFQTEAGLTQYVDIGDATPGKLAKLAAFISKSISTTSQALGSGQAPAATSFSF